MSTNPLDALIGGDDSDEELERMTPAERRELYAGFRKRPQATKGPVAPQAAKLIQRLDAAIRQAKVESGEEILDPSEVRSKHGLRRKPRR